MEDLEGKRYGIILKLFPVVICLMIIGTINIDVHAFSTTPQTPYPEPKSNASAANDRNIHSKSLSEFQTISTFSHTKNPLASSLSELMDSINKARPGDHIILKDGKYDTGEWLQDNAAETMLVKARGTQDAPIVIAAESIGGVEITGPAGFEFQGSAYLVIKGFKFLHGQIDDRISIECSDCQHVRFTQNYFDLSEPNEESDWLGITGKNSVYNRIDYNTFANKETAGNFVLILGSDEKMPQYNKIDHNHFTSHTYSSGNGGECLRIGNSAYATKDSMTAVEYNVFEKCDGDAEVISVKSSNNIIRFNEFKDNRGSVVLRHGNKNQIDGNIFLQNEGGVRIYGYGHNITNNYFKENHGEGVLQTLIIGNGTVEEDEEGSNAEYRLSEGVLVLNNTFVDNKSNIVYGYGSGNLEPTDIQINGNIADGDDGKIVQYVGED